MKQINIAIFLLISGILFFVVVPLPLKFPETGLDPSWQFAMTWAQSHGYTLGRDIVFTFGPYNSLYTCLYTPSSDFLTLISGGWLYLCCLFLFVSLYNGRNWKSILASLLVFCAFSWYRDSLFFSYIFLYLLTIHRFACQETAKLNLFRLAFVTSGCALIVLIKGSYTSAVLPICALSFGYCLYKRRRDLALVMGLSLFFTIPGLWILSGQPLLALPDWFRTLIPIISGYSDAMSVIGPKKDFALYLIPALAIILLIFLSELQLIDKIFLFCGLSFLFFIVFKAGFTRHDMHALLAFQFILIVLISIGLLQSNTINKFSYIFFIITFLCIFYIYPNSGILYHIQNSIYSGISGITSRINGKADIAYEEHIQKLKHKTQLPKVNGTSDIYAWDLTDLLVSGNTWNPRPIPQSYSAYTPELCRMNALSLKRENKGSPDTIFFRVQTIDNRFPAMDDGMSWPVLIGEYHATRFFRDTLLLSRNDHGLSAGKLLGLLSETVHLDQQVSVPPSEDPLFIRLKFRNGIWGRLRGLLYKSPQLYISFQLADGTEHSKRIIPGMTETGFFLSPYVADTGDFALLATNNLSLLESRKVTKFTISQQPGLVDIGLWDDEYQMELFRFHNTQPAADITSFFPAPQYQYVSPDALRHVTCTGNLDDLKVSKSSISARGWLIASQNPPRLPDQSYVIASTPEGPLLFSVSNEERPDVAAYFAIPLFADAGFRETSYLFENFHTEDFHQIALGYSLNGQLFQCTNLQKNLDMVQ